MIPATIEKGEGQKKINSQIPNKITWLPLVITGTQGSCKIKLTTGQFHILICALICMVWGLTKLWQWGMKKKNRHRHRHRKAVISWAVHPNGDTPTAEKLRFNLLYIAQRRKRWLS